MARSAERPSVDWVQRFFELSLDMLGTSEDGYFTELNPARERWLGWTREELMAEPFVSFIHPDDVASTTDRATAHADPGSEAVVTHENRYRSAPAATAGSTGRRSRSTASSPSPPRM